jgi:hypothetical protein
MRIFYLALLVTIAACGASSTAPEPIQITQPPAVEPAPRAGTGLVMSNDVCQTDADCVPAGCCHAAACTAATNAPSCGEVMCTQDCQYGTLDCGGACLCQDGHCAARLSEPPAALQELVPTNS